MYTHFCEYLQVDIVNQMVTTCASMKCFLKGVDNSSILQYSNSSVNTNDGGDGGGIPAFTFLSISSFGMFLNCKFCTGKYFLLLVLHVTVLLKPKT